MYRQKKILQFFYKCCFFCAARYFSKVSTYKTQQILRSTIFFQNSALIKRNKSKFSTYKTQQIFISAVFGCAARYFCKSHYKIALISVTFAKISCCAPKNSTYKTALIKKQKTALIKTALIGWCCVRGYIIITVRKIYILYGKIKLLGTGAYIFRGG